MPAINRLSGATHNPEVTRQAPAPDAPLAEGGPFEGKPPVLVGETGSESSVKPAEKPAKAADSGKAGPAKPTGSAKA